MPTSDERPGLVTDDRGAIMVMGIFMCSCLVGALWYLAGIGDAILYRERLQEAADAVAFSDAALHARGMNLIVLINLVMATILALRVALRVGKLVLAVAAAAFAGLGFTNPALWTGAPPTAGAAATVNSIDNATKDAIDGALRALNVAQTAISRSTPHVARAGARLVAEKYNVTAVAVTQPNDQELPVEHARPEILCKKASVVFPEIHDRVLDAVKLGFVATLSRFFVHPLMEALVGADEKYFCGLEDSGGSQSNNNNGNTKSKGSDSLIDKEIFKAAVERCKDPEEAVARHFDNAEAEWQKACVKAGVICEGRDLTGLPLSKGRQLGRPTGKDAQKQQDELDRLALDRDEAVRSLLELKRQSRLPDFNTAKCISWATGDMKQRQSEQDALGKKQAQNNGQNNKGSQSQGGSNIAPMAVKGLRNGSKEGQFLAAVQGDPRRLQPSARLVRLGAFNDKRTPPLVEAESARMPAWAQAEMFFDCVGGWDGKGCNKDDDAMWHFKWRPRLRRFNQPVGATLQRFSGDLTFPQGRGPERFADDVARDALAPAVGSRSNGALRRDLVNSIQDDTTHAQGVH